jgi:hypothetical protein
MLYRIGEALLAILIIAFVLYKLALNLDMVPEGFSPSGFATKEYNAFKTHLKAESSYPNLIGKISKILLRNIERVENYYQDQILEDQQQNKIAEECKENSIFRFFMFWGADNAENRKCIKKNLQLQKAMKDNVPGYVAPKNDTEPPSTVGNGTARQTAPISPEEQLRLDQERQQMMQDQMNKVQQEFKPPAAPPAPVPAPVQQPAPAQ